MKYFLCSLLVSGTLAGIATSVTAQQMAPAVSTATVSADDTLKGHCRCRVKCDTQYSKAIRFCHHTYGNENNDRRNCLVKADLQYEACYTACGRCGSGKP